MSLMHPKIEEELRRHAWAMTDAAIDAFLSAAQGEKLTDEDVPKFHAALIPIENEIGRAVTKEFNYGRIEGKIGILRVEGPLTPRASWITEASGLTSTDLLDADLCKMEHDPRIDRIALIYDTPGGAVTGTSEFAARIRSSSKPVFSYAAGLMASAGYWSGSAADMVFASDTAIIGSIGTVMTLCKNADDSRVKIVSKQSPKKHLEPETEEGRAEAQTLVDDLSDVFIDTVASNRGTTREDVLSNYGQGGVFVASRALAAGMIDGISTFADFMKMVAMCNPKKRREQKNKKGIDGSSTLGAESGQQGEAIAAIGAKKMGDLNQMLASDAEAKAAYDKAIAEAEAAGIAKANAELERLSADSKKSNIAFAAKIASSSEYPQMVRDIAANVLTGEASIVELRAVSAVADMDRERVKSEAAKNAQPPSTPGQQPEAADDGVVNASNFKSAAARLKEMRGVR